MRTKTLLLSAVLGVVGLATSFAQVYSVNAVGYVNLSVPGGLSIIANPLNVVAGNTVSTVLNGAVAGTAIYKFNGTGYDINSFDAPPAGGAPEWGDPTQLINPGDGFWINNPNTTPITITFVGDVVQGAAITTPLRQGLNLVASQVPQQGALQTLLAFPAVDGDFVYRWNAATKGYLIYSYAAPPAGGAAEWDEEPVINVGEGFFVNKKAAVNWVRNFTVN